ncbi:glycoside hydrolase family 65 protein [Desulfopila sp. IMCC35006]|uniref:glycoside hydrolase family 65 protein n=1 Tax=Desulfopila sp. IMCC35006 TaxID=2569542 RepID=UPI0010AC2B7F|nr:glycosyl hydrolase family 65 protein [Desulfopila sp. IMCC35006]TKB26298.1 glycoside hydrolase family 65 protein [Desulfopila sp. IMCC35006]
MLYRERLNPPSYIYPGDEWKIIEKEFYPSLLGQMETIFALSNGYLGMRGTSEEGTPFANHGTLINGFYESWPIIYGENAYGFAKTGQTIVNIHDLKIIRLFVDDEPFSLLTADMKSFNRTLDMKEGTLTRDILWEMPSGKLVSIKSTRLVSFEHWHLAIINYEVTILNSNASVVILSEITPHRTIRGTDGDPRETRVFREKVLLPQARMAEEMQIILGFRTQNSGMSLGCGIDHSVETENVITAENEAADEEGNVVFTIDARQNSPVRLIKWMSFHTSSTTAPEDLCKRVGRTLRRAKENGYETILNSQKLFLDNYWQASDVQMAVTERRKQGGRTTEQWQQAIRWNLFQLCQASMRTEGTGIPAKGLTGTGYEGHYFWDIEIYVLPFLIYTKPRIAKNLLKFRYGMLDQARQRARDVNQKGALFPWRTINGEEASAYYAAGTAQYHINADIMFGLKKYVEVTGDFEFLYREGVEMLVETARLWCDLGFFSERQNGQFCIHGVTGPDEYNTVVNNNAYTNLMARENLRYAAATVEELRQKDAAGYQFLVDKTGLVYAEVEEWQRAADKMYIPYDDELQIHLQDDTFLEKKEWDIAGTPPENFPLLLHYHPLVIYRHRVIKQPDLVLALFLLGNQFSAEEKERNFDYYDRLTTGDSSLSVGIQAIVAAEINNNEKAQEYGRFAVLMDLADVGGNSGQGCHIASIGAAWMVLVYGYAGMRDYGGSISFNPKLPDRCTRFRFRLTVRKSFMEVEILPGQAIYRLVNGPNLSFHHNDKKVELTSQSPEAVCAYAGAAPGPLQCDL